jgi:hypothetical protein
MPLWEQYADQAAMHIIAARMSDAVDVLELLCKARVDLERAIEELETPGNPAASKF